MNPFAKPDEDIAKSGEFNRHRPSLGIKEVNQLRDCVQRVLDNSRVNQVRNKLSPSVLQDIGLGFPSVQHDGDFPLGRPRAVSSLVQHLEEHIVVLDKRGQLVGAQLATQTGEDVEEFSLIYETFLAGLGKRGYGLHRIYDGACSLRRRQRVLCVYLKEPVQRLHGFLSDFDSVFIFSDRADDVEYECAEGGGGLGAGLLGNAGDRAKGGYGLLKGHASLSGDTRRNRHTLRQLFDAGGVVVLDDVCGVQRPVQRFYVAVHLPRSIAGYQEFVGDRGGNVADELRLGGDFGKLLGHIAETRFCKFSYAFQIVFRRNAVSGRHFICGLRCSFHLCSCPVRDLLDVGKLRVHFFHGGQGFPQASDDFGDNVPADIPPGEFLDVHPEGFRHLVQLARFFAGLCQPRLLISQSRVQELDFQRVVFAGVVQPSKCLLCFTRFTLDFVEGSFRVLRFQVFNLTDEVGVFLPE